MKTRASSTRRRALAACLLGLAALVPAATALSASSAQPLTGSVVQTNKTWICKGAVDLTSVSVTFDQSFAAGSGTGPGSDDAVHLSHGCTGRIGSLTVVQYHGDAVKVGGGSHDLTIGGGSIRCYAHDPGKHQDGIQAMGGQRVTFKNLDIQCDSSNNAAFFANHGTNSPEDPTDVTCVGCFLEGGGITVRIGHSVRSGILDSAVVAGHIAPVRIDKAGAVDAIYTGNVAAAAGAGLAAVPGVPAPPPPVRHAAPKVTRTSVAVQLPLRTHHAGTTELVKTSVTVDEGAVLRVSVGRHGATALVPLLKGTRVGTAVTGYRKAVVVAHAAAAGALPLTLRIARGSLVPGRVYEVRIAATDASGATGRLVITFRR